MLKLFASTTRNGEIDYWQESIHTFFTSFEKESLNTKIKEMLKLNVLDSDLGFYELSIKDNPEFIRLGVSDHKLFMARFKQITLFFLIDGNINANAVRTLARRIDMLEVHRENVFKNFDTLIKEDKLANIQDQIGETKEVLHKAIVAVLDRGEKLDELIDKSNELKLKAGVFKSRAKKLNSCC